MAKFTLDDANTQERSPQKKKALLAQINLLEVKAEELGAKAEELESKLAESEEEADLLLLQLHQVQEELEQYFLRCSELEAKVASLEAERIAAQEKEQRILVRLGQSEQLLSKAMKYIGSLRHNPRMPHRNPGLYLFDDHQGSMIKI